MADDSSSNGPVELNKAPMARKDLFVRHFTRKMSGLALGRSLTLPHNCALDAIVEKGERENESAQALIRKIPFRAPFQALADPRAFGQFVGRCPGAEQALERSGQDRRWPLYSGIEHDKLPVVVGGPGGRRIATGQHRVYVEDTPLANL